MFKKRSIVGAMEIGTSKFTVLVGEAGDDERLEVVGKGESFTEGCVVKGEIVDMDAAIDRACAALDEADRTSGGKLGAMRTGVVAVSGAGIESFQGMGSVFIRAEDRRITQSDMDDAGENALVRRNAPDRMILCHSEAYYMIDEQRRIRHPLGQIANRLDAYVHVVHGIANRLENFSGFAAETGFFEQPELIFSGMAASIGVLAREELESGVLLVDFGAGVTDYIVHFDNGVLASGQLQIGFEHVLNDLAMAFNLPQSQWKKLAVTGTLNDLLGNRLESLELPTSTGRVRKIPGAAISTVVDLRLRELFGIVRKRLETAGVLAVPASGGVLTGGGAMLDHANRVFREVFEQTCRVGCPVELGGAISELDSPRYATVAGALKIADSLVRARGPEGGGALTGVLDRVGSMAGRCWRAVLDIKGAVRV